VLSLALLARLARLAVLLASLWSAAVLTSPCFVENAAPFSPTHAGWPTGYEPVIQ